MNDAIKLQRYRDVPAPSSAINVLAGVAYLILASTRHPTHLTSDKHRNYAHYSPPSHSITTFSVRCLSFSAYIFTSVDK